MRRLPSRLPGPVLIELVTHRDARGFFAETYRADTLAALGVDVAFVQDNHSRSQRGVVRGLHLQIGAGQAKLVRVARGAILDVVVDVRPGSPTFGEWEGLELSEDNGRELFVPVGFAHGFAVLSEVADVVYKCSSYYDPALERAIAHDDPGIGIAWPEGERTVSDRDRAAPRLAEVAGELRFDAPPGVF